jgi:hypothetical protein
MATMTVISDDCATTVDAVAVDGQLLVAPAAITAALGWELKPEGLCRDDVCVPVLGRLAAGDDGRVDLLSAADVLRRPTLLDADAGVLVVGVSAADRGAALTGLLPAFSLPDLDGVAHATTEWRAKKKLLVAFASW